MKKVNQREKKRLFYCPMCGREVLGTPINRKEVNDDCQCPKCFRKYVIQFDCTGWLDMFIDRRVG